MHLKLVIQDHVKGGEEIIIRESLVNLFAELKQESQSQYINTGRQGMMLIYNVA